jgi:hypothetical protein
MSDNIFRSGWRYSRAWLTGLLLLFSCGPQHEALLKTLQELDAHMLATGYYVVIPNQGCEGCISTAESFVKQHYASAGNIKYVFTRISSLKLLKIKLGSDVAGSRKVLLDTANSIRYPDRSHDIYPMIVHIRNRRITGVSYQSPGSEGLEALLKAP